MNSSEKQMNEFVFSSMRHVFVHFFDKIEDSKKAFRKYLTIEIPKKEENQRKIPMQLQNKVSLIVYNGRKRPTIWPLY